MTNVCRLVRKNGLDNSINESNSWSEMCSVAEVLTWMAETNRGLCFSRNTTSRGRELLACAKVRATISGVLFTFFACWLLYDHKMAATTPHTPCSNSKREEEGSRRITFDLYLYQKRKSFLRNQPLNQIDTEVLLTRTGSQGHLWLLGRQGNQGTDLS